MTRGGRALDFYVLRLGDGAVRYEERSAPEADARIVGPERAWVEAFGLDGSRTELEITGDARLAEAVLDDVDGDGRAPARRRLSTGGPRRQLQPPRARRGCRARRPARGGLRAERLRRARAEQLLELRGRHRPGEQVALGGVQPSSRRLSSCSAFSTPSAIASSPRLFGDLDDRADDRRVLVLGAEAVDERAVDLDRVDREAA